MVAGCGAAPNRNWRSPPRCGPDWNSRRWCPGDRRSARGQRRAAAGGAAPATAIPADPARCSVAGRCAPRLWPGAPSGSVRARAQSQADADLARHQVVAEAAVVARVYQPAQADRARDAQHAVAAFAGSLQVPRQPRAQQGIDGDAGGARTRISRSARASGSTLWKNPARRCADERSALPSASRSAARAGRCRAAPGRPPRCGNRAASAGSASAADTSPAGFRPGCRRSRLRRRRRGRRARWA